MINTFNFPKQSNIDAINRIRLKIGINDSSKDELLTILFEDASNLICSYINTETVPQKFTWIAENIAIKGFRKIGSEGMKSKQIDVINKTFEDSVLDEFKDVLDEYNKSNSRKLRLF